MERQSGFVEKGKQLSLGVVGVGAAGLLVDTLLWQEFVSGLWGDIILTGGVGFAGFWLLGKMGSTIKKNTPSLSS